MLNRLTYELTTTIDLREFLFRLFLSGILGILMTLFYLNFRTERFNSLQYAKILLPLLLIMTLTTAVVSSSVSLALGLLGSLSIIRFRMQPPGIEQIIYVLLAVGAGVAMGRGQCEVAFIAVGSIGVVVWLSQWWMARKPDRLRISIRIQNGQGTSLGATLKASFPDLQFRQYVLEAGQEELVYRYRARDLQQLHRLTTAIRQADEKAAVSIAHDPE